VAVILEFMNAGGLDNIIRKAPGNCVPEPVLAAMAYQVREGGGGAGACVCMWWRMQLA
jgi:hypothetical protein